MPRDERKLAAQIAPTIGSYRSLKPLGSGGMSSVYHAIHIETGVEVAVKVLPRTLARNETLLRRFLREARSAESLEHPSIVAIYDRGVDDGRYYLVLEFVPGGDLHDWVRVNGPMPVAQAIGVVRSVAEGLRFAAGRGVIHRDIKPANLLMTAAGRVKIADLGLALHSEDEDERVTREGTTVGTVDYMAPEQAKDSRGTSERSDIYSLGCTFFYLLTGQPPFAGGDVTEKLTRHFTSPPPDPAEFRVDVPVELIALIRKMMAKRPESRYSNYDELIVALDAIQTSPPEGVPEGETLDALIVDDEEVDESTSGPGFQPLVGGDIGSAPPPPLFALIDEDDDPALDRFESLSVAPGRELTQLPSRPDPAGPSFSMADLAGFADEGEESSEKSRARSTPTKADFSPPGSTASTPRTFLEDAGDDDQAADGLMPGQVNFGSSRRMSEAERSWLVGLVLAGAGLIVGVIAFHQLYLATTSGPDPRAQGELTSGEAASPPALPLDNPRGKLQVEGVKTTAPKAEPNRPPVNAQPGPPAEVVWTEPIESAPPYVAEAAFDPGIEASYRPEWLDSDPIGGASGKVQTVRRLADTGVPDQKNNIGSTLDASGGTIELADNGPFFEDDLHLTGETRVIRARPGFRPVVCLETPQARSLDRQGALIDVDNRSLALEGIDLVVDAKVLPRTFSSVFLCRGGRLTLKNCTVSVVNRMGLPISVFQTREGPRASRLRLETTFVRGAYTSAIEIASGGADVVVTRSAVVNGHGVGVIASGSSAMERRVFVTRSVFTTGGPAFEIVDPPRGDKPRRLVLNALGSTFVRFPIASGTSGVSLINGGSDGSLASETVSWRGDFNEFAGWADWLSAGHNHSILVPGLNAARTIWPGTDPTSRELRAPSTVPTPADRLTPFHLRSLAPGREDVLARVAVPTPWILEKTLDPFPHPAMPGLSTAADARTPARGDSLTDASANPSSSSAPTSPGVRELTFKTEASPWNGDLGRFLAGSITPDDSLVRVRVIGSTTHVWSPVTLPDGVSLDVIVTPDSQGRMPSWSAAKVEAEALIDVNGGTLILNGVALRREGSASLQRLVRVKRGHLVIHRCRLLSKGRAVDGGGGLIEFLAPGSQPLRSVTVQGQPWPFDSTVDRPTCRITESVLITPGDVVVSEVGRGFVAVSQCLIASGKSAFTLLPNGVASNRFNADLWIDRSTLASEDSFIKLGHWPGSEPGPDRPWLVATNHCGFFTTYARPSNNSVLLQVDPESFAHGALFWQAKADAFEVKHLALSAGSPIPENRRVDVVRQWVALWGRSHVQAVTGPHAPSGQMTRALVGRLKPGDVDPGNLAIDPDFPPGDPPRDLGADLERLGIKPSPVTAGRR